LTASNLQLEVDVTWEGGLAVSVTLFWPLSYPLKRYNYTYIAAICSNRWCSQLILPTSHQKNDTPWTERILWYQLWDRKTLLRFGLHQWSIHSKCWQGFPISKLLSENSLFCLARSQLRSNHFQILPWFKLTTWKCTTHYIFP